MTGIHGCGVSTPSAAAVADATCGFASDEHIPQVGIFAADVSAMVATGFPSARSVLCDVTARLAGVVPNGHSTDAPATTANPIHILLSPEL